MPVTFAVPVNRLEVLDNFRFRLEVFIWIGVDVSIVGINSFSRVFGSTGKSWRNSKASFRELGKEFLRRDLVVAAEEDDRLLE
jgi:hypothetical protein